MGNSDESVSKLLAKVEILESEVLALSLANERLRAGTTLNLADANAKRSGFSVRALVRSVCWIGLRAGIRPILKVIYRRKY